jgi:secondary thiamine-phosphate synthase enzyme
MTIAQHLLEVRTRGQGLHEVTREVAAWVREQPVARGLLTVFIRHTSASLVIQENAAPAASRDLEAFMARIAPEDPNRYEHDDEGPDDMPAHLRTALTHTSLSIPVADRRLLLGTWQGVFIFEHRRAAHRRELVLHLAGE